MGDPIVTGLNGSGSGGGGGGGSGDAGCSDGGPSSLMGVGPPSPLTGCYLMIVIGEPHSDEHKDIILQRLLKGFLSWNVSNCQVNLEEELNTITLHAPEGEEARHGERLIQYASENLVTEILIHPQYNTLIQCMRNLLSSFTRHRHIIHTGYTFSGNGSWIVQDGTFSVSDFSEAFQEHEVQRVLRAYPDTITMDIHCEAAGLWSVLPDKNFTKSCRIRINPVDVLNSGSDKINAFVDYLAPMVIPASLNELLESSDVVGNIRFSHPTLYVFPGGQGDAALFGINGFNMLVDGGFGRKACFWDFTRHLDRLDAVLMTRISNCNINGIGAVAERKRDSHVYPQIGHFFCNIPDRKPISPDGDKDKDPLMIDLFEKGHQLVSNLRAQNLHTQNCYKDSEPINLYHKVGHGTLDMYVLSPSKDAKEVKEFLQKWNSNDPKLFAPKDSKEFMFPIQNLISICALLVWLPANPEESITRILFPGSTPDYKIIEGLEKIKHLEFMKHPVCNTKTIAPSISSMTIGGKKSLKSVSQDTKTGPDLILPSKPNKPLGIVEKEKDNKILDNKLKSIQSDNKIKDMKSIAETPNDSSSTEETKIEKRILSNDKKVDTKSKINGKDKAKVDTIKKLDNKTAEIIITSDEIEKKFDLDDNKDDNEKKLELDKKEEEKSDVDTKNQTETNVKKDETDTKTKSKVEVKTKSRVSETKSTIKSRIDTRPPKSMDKRPIKKESTDKKEPNKSSPTTTPKKSVVPPIKKEEVKPKILSRVTRSSPSSTPAKSAKDANNRKVLESKQKVQPAKREITKPAEKKETKIERKPISRRTKAESPSRRPIGSPIKSARPARTKAEKDSVLKKVKLDKGGTTDSSLVSTPSAEDTAILKKVVGLEGTPQTDSEKAHDIDDSKEEQEAVREIEAVFIRDSEIRKNDVISGHREVIDISKHDSTTEAEEDEEYLIIEKEEVEQYTEDSINEQESITKEEEIQKHQRDSEESEKKRKRSLEATEEAEGEEKKDEDEEERAEIVAIIEGDDKDTTKDTAGDDEDMQPDSIEEKIEIEYKDQIQEEVQEIITSAKEIAKTRNESRDESNVKTDEMSTPSPEDKISSAKKTSDTKDDIDEGRPKDIAEQNLQESQPDEKFSATAESGATTAPTLPEDERIPLDEIKEDLVVEEKYVKEQTKENEIPMSRQPPIVFEPTERIIPSKIQFDAQHPHLRDIVKTPDEVADLPVHEEVDYVAYDYAKKDESNRKSAEIKEEAKISAAEEKVVVIKNDDKDLKAKKTDDKLDDVHDKHEFVINEDKIPKVEISEIKTEIFEDKKDDDHKVIERLEGDKLDKKIKEDTQEETKDDDEEADGKISPIEIVEIMEAKKVDKIEGGKGSKLEYKERTLDDDFLKNIESQIICDKEIPIVKAKVIKHLDESAKVNMTDEELAAKVAEQDTIVCRKLPEKKHDLYSPADLTTLSSKVGADLQNFMTSKIDDEVKDFGDKISKTFEDIKTDTTNKIEDTKDFIGDLTQKVDEKLNDVKDKFETIVGKVDDKNEGINESLNKSDDTLNLALEKTAEIKGDADEKLAEMGDIIKSKAEKLEQNVEDIQTKLEEKIEEGKDTVTEKIEKTIETLEEGAEKTDELTQLTVDAISDKTKEIKEGTEDKLNEISETYTTTKDKVDETVEDLKVKLESSKDKIVEHVEDKLEIVGTKLEDGAKNAAEIVSSTVDAIGDKTKELKEGAEDKLNDVLDIFTTTKDKLGKTMEDIKDNVESGKEKIADNIEDKIEKVEAKLQEGAKKADKIATSTVDAIGDKTKELKEGAEDKLNDVLDTFTTTKDNLGETMEDIKDNVESEKHKISDIIEEKIEKVEAKLQEGAKKADEIATSTVDAIDDKTKELKEGAEDKLNDVLDTFTTTKDNLGETMEDIKDNVESEKHKISDIIEEKIEKVEAKLQEGAKKADEIATSTVDAIGDKTKELKEGAENIFMELGDKFTSVKDKSENSVEDIKDKISDQFDSDIKKLDKKIDDKLQEGSSVLDNIATSAFDAVDETDKLKDTAENKFNDITDKIGEKIEAGKDTIADKVEEKINKIDAKLHEGAKIVDETAKSAVETISNKTKQVETEAEEKLKELGNKVTIGTEKIGEKFEDMQTKISETVESGKDVVKKTEDNIKSEIGTAIDKAETKVKDTVEKAEHKVEEVTAKVGEMATGIEDKIKDTKTKAETEILKITDDLQKKSEEVQEKSKSGISSFFGGITQGIKSGIDKLTEKIDEKIKDGTDTVESKLGELSARTDKLIKNIETKEIDNSKPLEDDSSKLRDELIDEIFENKKTQPSTNAEFDKCEYAKKVSPPYEIKGFSTELRETHITTLDSPIKESERIGDAKILEKLPEHKEEDLESEDSANKPISSFHIEEIRYSGFERDESNLNDIKEEEEEDRYSPPCKKDDDKSSADEKLEPPRSVSPRERTPEDVIKIVTNVAEVLKSDKDLTEIIPNFDPDELEKKLSARGSPVKTLDDSDGESKTVKRMLVTASSEDGGGEIVICPPGSITFFPEGSTSKIASELENIEASEKMDEEKDSHEQHHSIDKVELEEEIEETSLEKRDLSFESSTSTKTIPDESKMKSPSSSGESTPEQKTSPVSIEEKEKHELPEKAQKEDKPTFPTSTTDKKFPAIPKDNDIRGEISLKDKSDIIDSAEEIKKKIVPESMTSSTVSESNKFPTVVPALVDNKFISIKTEVESALKDEKHDEPMVNVDNEQTIGTIDSRRESAISSSEKDYTKEESSIGFDDKDMSATSDKSIEDIKDEKCYIDNKVQDSHVEAVVNITDKPTAEKIDIGRPESVASNKSDKKPLEAGLRRESGDSHQTDKVLSPENAGSAKVSRPESAASHVSDKNLQDDKIDSRRESTASHVSDNKSPSEKIEFGKHSRPDSAASHISDVKDTNSKIDSRRASLIDHLNDQELNPEKIESDKPSRPESVASHVSHTSDIKDTGVNEQFRRESATSHLSEKTSRPISAASHVSDVKTDILERDKDSRPGSVTSHISDVKIAGDKIDSEKDSRRESFASHISEKELSPDKIDYNKISRPESVASHISDVKLPTEKDSRRESFGSHISEKELSPDKIDYNKTSRPESVASNISEADLLQDKCIDPKMSRPESALSHVSESELTEVLQNEKNLIANHISVKSTTEKTDEEKTSRRESCASHLSDKEITSGKTEEIKSSRPISVASHVSDNEKIDAVKVSRPESASSHTSDTKPSEHIKVEQVSRPESVASHVSEKELSPIKTEQDKISRPVSSASHVSDKDTNVGIIETSKMSRPESAASNISEKVISPEKLITSRPESAASHVSDTKTSLDFNNAGKESRPESAASHVSGNDIGSHKVSRPESAASHISDIKPSTEKTEADKHSRPASVASLVSDIKDTPVDALSDSRRESSVSHISSKEDKVEVDKLSKPLSAASHISENEISTTNTEALKTSRPESVASHISDAKSLGDKIENGKESRSLSVVSHVSERRDEQESRRDSTASHVSEKAQSPEKPESMKTSRTGSVASHVSEKCHSPDKPESMKTSRPESVASHVSEKCQSPDKADTVKTSRPESVASHVGDVKSSTDKNDATIESRSHSVASHVSDMKEFSDQNSRRESAISHLSEKETIDKVENDKFSRPESAASHVSETKSKDKIEIEKDSRPVSALSNVDIQLLTDTNKDSRRESEASHVSEKAMSSHDADALKTSRPESVTSQASDAKDSRRESASNHVSEHGKDSRPESAASHISDEDNKNVGNHVGFETKTAKISNAPAISEFTKDIKSHDISESECKTANVVESVEHIKPDSIDPFSIEATNQPTKDIDIEMKSMSREIRSKSVASIMTGSIYKLHDDSNPLAALDEIQEYAKDDSTLGSKYLGSSKCSLFDEKDHSRKTSVTSEKQSPLASPGSLASSIDSTKTKIETEISSSSKSSPSSTNITVKEESLYTERKIKDITKIDVKISPEEIKDINIGRKTPPTVPVSPIIKTEFVMVQQEKTKETSEISGMSTPKDQSGKSSPGLIQTSSESASKSTSFGPGSGIDTSDSSPKPTSPFPKGITTIKSDEARTSSGMSSPDMTRMSTPDIMDSKYDKSDQGSDSMTTVNTIIASKTYKPDNVEKSETEKKSELDEKKEKSQDVRVKIPTDSQMHTSMIAHPAKKEIISLKSSETRSYTPGSDDYDGHEIHDSPRSDISSGQVSRVVPGWTAGSSEERHYSDDEIPSSPLSVTSQAAHSPPSKFAYEDHYDLQRSSSGVSKKSDLDIDDSQDDIPPQYGSDELKSAISISSTYRPDPMSTSFYGALPEMPTSGKSEPIPISGKSTMAKSYLDFQSSGPDSFTDTFTRTTGGDHKFLDEADLDFEKALEHHRQVRGADVMSSITSKYEYSPSKQEDSSHDNVNKEFPLEGIQKPKTNGADPKETEDTMDAAAILKEKEEFVASWGKPLGLPVPGPAPAENDVRTTPKKERRLIVNSKTKLNNEKNLRKRSESPIKNKKNSPIYMDLTYVPHHGNSYYSHVEFFKRVRARYYVFSGTEPSREVYNALLEAKQTWEDKDLEVTIIPTYDTDVLGYWVSENEDLLAKYHIDLSPSASRCTINLQDHETSCSAYRLEF